MIYLFVPDDSLTSERFTTRTEELNKCYEPLQKMRVRLWPCKASNFVLLIVPRLYFCGCSFCFMAWCLRVLRCWRLMYVLIFLVKFRSLSGHLLGK